jgi:hypothetical protein
MMTNFSKHIRWTFVVLVGCVVLAFGCSKVTRPDYPTTKVIGTVKVDGTPIEQGRIRFSPTEPTQSPAVESVVSNGGYTADNVPIGKVLVTFTGEKKTGRQIELYGKTIDQTVNVIPTKYSRGMPVTLDANTTGNRDFNLTSN